jgi:uncharacterized protein (DUF2461 family)
MVQKSNLEILKKLITNNNREWFAAHKSEFLAEKQIVETFFKAILENFKKHDSIESLKMFRICK